MSKHHQYPSATSTQAHHVQKQPSQRRTKLPAAHPKHRLPSQPPHTSKIGTYVIWTMIIGVLLFTVPPLLFYLMSNTSALFDFLSVFVTLVVGAVVLVFFIRHARGLPDLDEVIAVHRESAPTLPTETIDPNATYMLTSDGEVVEVEEDHVPPSAVSIQLNHRRDHQEH
ncbi:MAG: hypothetical protein U0694_07955 [Anaerolineae bacterium]